MCPRHAPPSAPPTPRRADRDRCRTTPPYCSTSGGADERQRGGAPLAAARDSNAGTARPTGSRAFGPGKALGRGRVRFIIARRFGFCSWVITGMMAFSARIPLYALARSDHPNGRLAPSAVQGDPYTSVVLLPGRPASLRLDRRTSCFFLPTALACYKWTL